MHDSAPRVVIVGGGFGGLAAAKALRKTDAQVVLVDRQNHHLFQPVLYQVATSVLSPGQIASPIRSILRNQRNTTVILGEVTGVDSDRRRVFVDSVDREASLSSTTVWSLRPEQVTAISATTNSRASLPGSRAWPTRCDPKSHFESLRAGGGRRGPDTATAIC